MNDSRRHRRRHFAENACCARAFLRPNSHTICVIISMLIKIKTGARAQNTGRHTRARVDYEIKMKFVPIETHFSVNECDGSSNATANDANISRAVVATRCRIIAISATSRDG